MVISIIMLIYQRVVPLLQLGIHGQSASVKIQAPQVDSIGITGFQGKVLREVVVLPKKNEFFAGVQLLHLVQINVEGHSYLLSPRMKFMLHVHILTLSKWRSTFGNNKTVSNIWQGFFAHGHWTWLVKCSCEKKQKLSAHQNWWFKTNNHQFCGSVGTLVLARTQSISREQTGCHTPEADSASQRGRITVSPLTSNNLLFTRRNIVSTRLSTHS